MDSWKGGIELSLGKMKTEKLKIIQISGEGTEIESVVIDRS